MSQCDIYCEGEEEGHAHLIITHPQFTSFMVYVRGPYERKWKFLGKSRSQRKAQRMLADAMMDSKWKRGVVAGDEGPMSYYGATKLVEMTR